MRLIELGHEIRDGMAAYPGLPAARVYPFVTHEGSRARYEHQAEFALTATEFAGNTGTYLDSPWHRHPGGPDIGTLPLETVAALPGLVEDARPRAQGLDASIPRDIEGCALLIRTGWSDRWGTEEYWDGPHLGTALLDAIVDARPALIGVDIANVDDPSDPSRPAHTRLLEAGILIVENLCNLAALPADGFRFHCAPLRVHGAASMPVRPYAEIPDTQRSRKKGLA